MEEYFEMDISGVVDRILKNTNRYIELLYKVIFEELMPEPRVKSTNLYAEILNEQRKSRMQANSNQRKEGKKNCYPEKLFRN